MRILIVEPIASAAAGAPDAAASGAALADALAGPAIEVRRLSVAAVDGPSPRAIHCPAAARALGEELASLEPDRVVLVDPLRLPADLALLARQAGCATALWTADRWTAGTAHPSTPVDRRPAPPRSSGEGISDDGGSDAAAPSPGPLPPLDPNPGLARALAHLAADLVAVGGPAEVRASILELSPAAAEAAVDDDLCAAAEQALSAHRRVARWAVELDRHRRDLESPRTLGSVARGLRRRAKRLIKRLR